MANPIRQLIQTALEDGVFPGGVLLASKHGKVAIREAFGWTDIYHKIQVDQDTVYDLASLTKPLATTLAVMHLVDRSRLHLGQTLGELLSACRGTEKAGITVEYLLAHCSGLPDYRPYYMELAGETALERDSALKALLIREPLEYPVGRKTVYSDLGFMFLRWIVEQVSGAKMSRLVKKEIYAPAGAGDLFFPGNAQARSNRVFAPTEMCAWRNSLVQGTVHDENAFAVGGVDGHAGLFGTDSAVHALLLELMSAYSNGSSGHVLSPGQVRTFLNYGAGGERALGFDRPTHPGSSSGRYYSENSVGHLGFTGTSFWVDLDRDIIVILLTNRIHPTRDNEKIKAFRPILHDAVMEYLL